MMDLWLKCGQNYVESRVRIISPIYKCNFMCNHLFNKFNKLFLCLNSTICFFIFNAISLCSLSKKLLIISVEFFVCCLFVWGFLFTYYRGKMPNSSRPLQTTGPLKSSFPHLLSLKWEHFCS